MNAVGRDSSGPSAAKVIAQAGLIAGISDITYVFVYFGYRGVPADRILKSISAALIGRDAAFAGGWEIALMGLAMHFGVALAVAAVFYAASRKISVLTRAWLLSGAMYGALVWLVMNLAVLPLTATPPKSFPPPGWLVIFIAHLICVGPPIAFVVSRYPRGKV